MGYAEEELVYIYYKTNGYCRLCDRKLSLVNYNRPGRRGAWHVDHSNPRSRGGTDYLRNLFPACIGCNQVKSDFSSRTARRYLWGA
jgi:5-methylcytosine-specific restriction endonuclease McrA